MHCGTKILLQKSIKQSVEIDHSRLFKNWIELGTRALNSRNYDSAERYAEKILEQDIEAGMGWLILACASSCSTDRRWEAYDHFEEAAEKMSYDEKIENGEMFISYLSSSVYEELPDIEDGNYVDLNIDAVNNIMRRESGILNTFFSDLSEIEQVELLEWLFEYGKEASWQICWEAMELILVYYADESLTLAWSCNHRKMELCLKAASIIKERKDLLACSPNCVRLIKDIKRIFKKYMSDNAVKVEMADKWWISNPFLNDDDPDHNEIRKTVDAAYELYFKISNDYFSTEDIQIDESIAKWTIGKQRKEEVIKIANKSAVAEAKSKVTSRMPEVWDMVIDSVIKYGPHR